MHNICLAEMRKVPLSKLYLWYCSLAGNLILVSIILLCSATVCAYPALWNWAQLAPYTRPTHAPICICEVSLWLRNSEPLQLQKWWLDLVSLSYGSISKSLLLNVFRKKYSLSVVLILDWRSTYRSSQWYNQFIVTGVKTIGCCNFIGIH